MLSAKRSIAEVDLEALGAELTKRHRSIVDYRPSECCGSEGKLNQLTGKFYGVASRIQKAHPEEFGKCGPLVEELGKVLKAIQETHGQEWERMITVLKEVITLEQQTYMKGKKDETVRGGPEIRERV